MRKGEMLKNRPYLSNVLHFKRRLEIIWENLKICFNIYLVSLILTFGGIISIFGKTENGEDIDSLFEEIETEVEYLR